MNISDLIKNEKYYVKIDKDFRKIMAEKYKSSKKKIKISASNMTINRILYLNDYFTKQNTYFALTNTLGFSKQDANNGISLVRTRKSFPIPIRKIEINKQFLRILGHILGDGGFHLNIKEGKYRPFYSNNQQILLDSFNNDVKSVFGDINIYSRKRQWQGNEIWLPSSLGFILYKILEYKGNTHDKRIPKFIFDVKDKEIIGAFLQAFYDDDGYLYPQKHMIVISQKRIKLVNDIRNLVKKVGIRPNQLLVHKSKNRTTMHYFSITHKNNITKFDRIVGFKHPIKRKKLNVLVNKYKRR